MVCDEAVGICDEAGFFDASSQGHLNLARRAANGVKPGASWYRRYLADFRDYLSHGSQGG
jgi:hypothetical protein